jgi:hypothetical protein
MGQAFVQLLETLDPTRLPIHGGDATTLVVTIDLGRTRRLYTPAQRKALLVRDRTCRGEGCDVPGTWCEAHHLHPRR